VDASVGLVAVAGPAAAQLEFVAVRRGLPVRGQRTKTNARSRKGPKKAAIALKKKA